MWQIDRKSRIAGIWLALMGVCLAVASGGPRARAAVVEGARDQPVAAGSLATQGPKPKPIVPPTAAELRRAIERGVDFLLETQFPHGGWGSIASKKVYRIYAPIPGAHLAFRTAVTSLALLALLESRDQFTGERRQRIEASLDQGQAWLLTHAGHLRRAAPDGMADQLGYTLYNVWGHAYAIQALAGLHARAAGTQNKALRKELIELMAYQARHLASCATINGGWTYYDSLARTKRPSDSSMSFVTATVLIALQQAKPLGVEIPEKRTRQAVAALKRQRLPDFSYLYGEYLKNHPRMGINRPAGSLGRSQACNLALRLAGDRQVTDAVLTTWLNRLFARNGWLSMGRKGQKPHESYFMIAGYFYYYGHYYAAQCIEQLPADQRPYFQDHLAHILLPLQEKDGSWWDFPLYNYHQQYGTAMAVSALVRCQHAKPEPTPAPPDGSPIGRSPG